MHTKQMGEERRNDIVILIVLSLLLGLFVILYSRARPLIGGDAYEFAEITRNIVERGEMREDHLRTYNDPDLAIPHPAGQRANLYTLILIPFYLLLKESYLTVMLPSLLSHLMLVIMVYVFGRKYFSGNVGLYTAIIVLLHPQFIYHITFDPTPDITLSVLFLLTILLFLEKRYIATGISFALTFFIKQSAVILLPAFFLWILLYDRRVLKTKAIYLGLLSALIVGSPFFIRNIILFGNPIYTEEFKVRKVISVEDFKKGNALKYTLSLKESALSKEGVSGDKPFFFMTLKVWTTNIRQVFLGGTTVAQYPGFFDMIFLIFLPFFIIGVYSIRHNKTGILILIIISLLIGFQVFIVAEYKDRYIFPIIPLALYATTSGVFSLKKRFSFLDPRTLMVFLILSEEAFLFPLKYVGKRDMDLRDIYNEYRVCTRWIGENTDPSSVIITNVLFSTGFFTDRLHLPYPYGDLNIFKRIVEKYNATHLLFYQIPGIDIEFPRLEFMTPVAVGKRISLFRINKGMSSFDLLDKRHSYLLDFNFLKDIYVFSHKGHMDPTHPNYRFLLGITKDFKLALLCIIAAIVVFYLIFRIKRRPMKALAIILLAVYFLCIRFIFYSGTIKEMQPTRSYQFDQLMKTIMASREEDAAVIVLQNGLTDKFKLYLSTIFEHFNVEDRIDVPEKDNIYILPLKDTKTLLRDNLSIQRSALLENENDRICDDFRKSFKDISMEVERTRHACVAF